MKTKTYRLCSDNDTELDLICCKDYWYLQMQLTGQKKQVRHISHQEVIRLALEYGIIDDIENVGD